MKASLYIKWKNHSGDNHDNDNPSLRSPGTATGKPRLIMSAQQKKSYARMPLRLTPPNTILEVGATIMPLRLTTPNTILEAGAARCCDKLWEYDRI